MPSSGPRNEFCARAEPNPVNALEMLRSVIRPAALSSCRRVYAWLSLAPNCRWRKSLTSDSNRTWTLLKLASG